MQIITTTLVALAVAIPSIVAAQNSTPNTSTKAALSTGTLGAQPAKTFYACYVPNNGTTYRIKEVDLRETCSQNHVMFSWTDGGTPGPQGPKGDPGPEGPQGAKGDPGVSGFTSVEWVISTDLTVAPNQITVGAIQCPAGTTVIGGGYNTSKTNGVAPVISGSRVEYNGWLVAIYNNLPGAGTASVSVYAGCAK